SINNVCLGSSVICSDGKSHGVAIKPADHPNSYVVFQTSSDYAGRSSDDKDQDATFSASQGSIVSGASEVVFAQLSGTAASSTITTMQGGNTSVISISSDGRIKWSN